MKVYQKDLFIAEVVGNMKCKEFMKMPDCCKFIMRDHKNSFVVVS